MLLLATVEQCSESSHLIDIKFWSDKLTLMTNNGCNAANVH